MRKPLKIRLLQIASVFFLLIASGAVRPACWLHWYQPKLPE